ncbi:MAG: hypothetical protein ACRDIW_11185 [Actinomycetota bacterium]
MDTVIDLAAWRRDRASVGPQEERLQTAVDRLGEVLTERGEDHRPPWLVTELLAVQGCLSIGLTEEAAWRVERLVMRVERFSRPARRAR